MKPAPFELERPANVADATVLLQDHLGSMPLAGGQSLIPALNLRELRVRMLVDLTPLDELRGIEASGRLRIGAGEPMWDIEHEPLVAEHAPLLVHTLGTVGAPSIRVRATLGGSAAWSEPTSQVPAAMLALGATIVTTRRRLAAESFFHGPQSTELEPDELILALEMPSAAGSGFGLRHVRRSAITWPVVGCAATISLEGGVVSSARIALYGSAGRPLLATEAARALVGARPTGQTLEHAARLAAERADPHDDERASADYRARVLPVLVRRALRDATAGV